MGGSVLVHDSTPSSLASLAPAFPPCAAVVSSAVVSSAVVSTPASPPSSTGLPPARGMHCGVGRRCTTF